LLATMKCGVWTSIQVSGLSGGAGMLHTTLPAHRAITEANKAHRYLVGDIEKCVSQQVGACQVQEVLGGVLISATFFSSTLRFAI
jgi:hypothetical protein